MRSLYLFAIILSAKLHCYCKKEKAFEMIFSSDKHIHQVKSDALGDVATLASFTARVTSLARCEDDLYVSTAGYLANDNPEFRIKTFKPCTIWRVNLNRESSDNHKANLNFLKNFIKKECTRVLCMRVVKGYIYIGLSDGNILLCPLEEWNDCKVIYSYEKDITFEITGIDYSPYDEAVYATLPHSLLRCSFEDCKVIHRFENSLLSGFKVAFKAIWIGVNKTQLWKCSLKRELDCDSFYTYTFPESKITSIGATNKYLYISANDRAEITRCSPKEKSCGEIIVNPDIGMDRIIIKSEAVHPKQKCTLL